MALMEEDAVESKGSSVDLRNFLQEQAEQSAFDDLPVGELEDPGADLPIPGLDPRLRSAGVVGQGPRSRLKGGDA